MILVPQVHVPTFADRELTAIRSPRALRAPATSTTPVAGPQPLANPSFERLRGVRVRARLQLQPDTWFAELANTPHHKTLRCRQVDWLAGERQSMAPLPAAAPDTEHWVIRASPDPHLRFHTCDCSLDRAWSAGACVEARITGREVLAPLWRARAPPSAPVRQAADDHEFAQALALRAGRT